MLRVSGGRPRTERTPEEELGEIEREYAKLTSAERVVFDKMVAELHGATDPSAPSILQAFSSAELLQSPVPMEQFVKDPYYLGNTASNLYPKLLDDLTELFAGDYQLCLFAGSIGYGKSFAVSVGVCRVLYELSCMRNPHASLGIAPGTNISIVCFSVTEFLAQKVIMEYLVTKLVASPYFTEHFPCEVTKKELRFPRNVWVAPRASNDNSALGLNVISAFMDEVNFLHTPKVQMRAGAGTRAEGLFAKLYRRMKSRFERGGKLPGKMFVVSSAKTQDDFTATLVQQAKDDPSIFVRDYALWDVHPPERYTADRFAVLVGNDAVASKVLSESEEARFRAELPEGCALLDVPETFRPDFERDLEGAIRDLGGISTVAYAPFLSRREKIAEAVDVRLRHPFSKQPWDPSAPGEFLWSQMTKPFSERGEFGVREMRERPILHPSAPRHIHLDLAWTGDAAGFVMAHIGGYTDVDRRSPERGLYTERAPMIVVDAIIQVVPPVGGEILLADMRSLIYELTNHGYTIGKITMDSYQAVDTMQTLKAKGYDAEILSIDRKTDPYDTLKSALYENRVLYYECPALMKELRELERDNVKKKIDHPVNGSKDLADALAGVVFTLSQRPASKDPLPFITGSGAVSDPLLLQHANVTHDDVLPPLFGSGDD